MLYLDVSVHTWKSFLVATCYVVRRCFSSYLVVLEQNDGKLQNSMHSCCFWIAGNEVDSY
jgi:hypothetical protein